MGRLTWRGRCTGHYQFNSDPLLRASSIPFQKYPLKTLFMEIYKYLPEAVAREFLQNWSIGFTHPGQFNDSFDFVPVYTGRTPEDRNNIIEQRLEKFLSRDTGLTREEALRYLAHELDRFDNMEIGDRRTYVKDVSYWVSCFSRTETNLLMWAHYAKRSGIVVEFDSQAPLLKDQLRPVQYSQKRPTINIWEVDFKEKLPSPFFVKSLDWAYEQEERIVLSTDDVRRLKDAGEITPNKNASDDMRLLLVSVPPQYVRRIIVGSWFLPNRENFQLVSGFAQDPRKSHIVIDRARLDPSEYKIICEPVPPQFGIGSAQATIG